MSEGNIFEIFYKFFKIKNETAERSKIKNSVHQPGLEPGAVAHDESHGKR